MRFFMGLQSIRYHTSTTEFNRFTNMSAPNAPNHSPDPQFGEKLLEVVALYMKPPDNAVVLCVDEKTGIQALDRTQPMLSLRAAKPRSLTNEYVRHGTRTLLASLDVATGRVIAHVRKRRTSKDFLAFLDSVVKEYPNQRLYIVLDNLEYPHQ